MFNYRTLNRKNKKISDADKKAKVYKKKTVEQLTDEVMHSEEMQDIVLDSIKKATKNSIEGLFRSYGDAYVIIDKKIKDVMIPTISSYSFDDFTKKLHIILGEMKVELSSNRILENFENFFNCDLPKEVDFEDIWKEYKNYVSEECNRDDLSTYYDGEEERYDDVDVSCNFDLIGDREFKVTLKCDQDEELEFSFELRKSYGQSKAYYIKNTTYGFDISRLKYMDNFEVYIRSLSAASCDITMNRPRFDYYYDEVEIDGIVGED